MRLVPEAGLMDDEAVFSVVLVGSVGLVVVVSSVDAVVAVAEMFESICYLSRALLNTIISQINRALQIRVASIKILV